MSSIRDPRSSEGHKPRWELWGNVFLHQGYANVVNSLASLEVTTQSMEGVMVSEVRIPMDRLVWNVRLFRAQILDVYRAKDEYTKEIDIDWEQDVTEDPDKYFHKMLEVLYKRGLLKFKRQRSIGGPPVSD